MAGDNESKSEVRSPESEVDGRSAFPDFVGTPEAALAAHCVLPSAYRLLPSTAVGNAIYKWHLPF